MPRRVVVTGVGTINALGHTREQFWEALAAGRPGITAICGIPAGALRFPNGAQVHDFHCEKYFDAKDAAMLDRNAQFGAIAAREAVADSGVTLDPARTAIVTGCSVGGQETEDQQFEDLYRRESPRIHPMTIPRIMGNAGGEPHLAGFPRRYRPGRQYVDGVRLVEPCPIVATRFWMVRNGTVDAAIAGG